MMNTLPIFLSKKEDLELEDLKLKMDLIHCDNVMIINGGLVNKRGEKV
jgi:hypothetical protein